MYPIDIDQLVYIPIPHGRIIDEDEIYEQPHCGECNDATLDAINNAPTILESEEKDDTNNNGESDSDNSSLLPKAPMRSM